jgi:hypothetical protein
MNDEKLLMHACMHAHSKIVIETQTFMIVACRKVQSSFSISLYKSGVKEAHQENLVTIFPQLDNLVAGFPQLDWPEHPYHPADRAMLGFVSSYMATGPAIVQPGSPTVL